MQGRGDGFVLAVLKSEEFALDGRRGLAVEGNTEAKRQTYGVVVVQTDVAVDVDTALACFADGGD